MVAEVAQRAKSNRSGFHGVQHPLADYGTYRLASSVTVR